MVIFFQLYLNLKKLTILSNKLYGVAILGKISDPNSSDSFPSSSYRLGIESAPLHEVFYNKNKNKNKIKMLSHILLLLHSE